MKSLIIGYGSIGQRHFHLLKKMDHDVCVVSRRQIDVDEKVFSSIQECKNSGFKPNYVVVCVETSGHKMVLEELNKWEDLNAKVLVEKPLSSKNLPRVDKNFCEKITVAYQLRYDPLLQHLRQILLNKEIISFEVRACSYLPGWRPGRDYKQTESASAEKGGGVLNDLSHELDYLIWLFGVPKKISSVGGVSRALGISSEDHYFCQFLMESGAVGTLALSYLERPEERRVIVNTTDATYQLDIVGRSLCQNGELIKLGTQEDLEGIYTAQHLDALGENLFSCSYDHGALVVEMINNIRKNNLIGETI